MAVGEVLRLVLSDFLDVLRLALSDFPPNRTVVAIPSLRGFSFSSTGLELPSDHHCFDRECIGTQDDHRAALAPESCPACSRGWAPMGPPGWFHSDPVCQ